MWIHYETRKLYDKNIQLDKLDIDKLKNVPTNLRNLKTKVDNLDVDKLVPVSAHLSKLSDTVKNDIAKKDVYNAKIKNIEGKTPDITNLPANASFNVKINEVNTIDLATTTALIAVKNNMPSVSNLVKKTDYNIKIAEI